MPKFKVGDKVRVNKGIGYAFGESTIWEKVYKNRTIIVIEEVGGPASDSFGAQSIPIRATNQLASYWCVGEQDVTKVSKPTIIISED